MDYDISRGQRVKRWFDMSRRIFEWFLIDKSVRSRDVHVDILFTVEQDSRVVGQLNRTRSQDVLDIRCFNNTP